MLFTIFSRKKNIYIYINIIIFDVEKKKKKKRVRLEWEDKYHLPKKNNDDSEQEHNQKKKNMTTLSRSICINFTFQEKNDDSEKSAGAVEWLDNIEISESLS